MDSNTLTRSNQLLQLSQRFNHTKPISSPHPIEQTESNPSSHISKKPNRAAVLICLFEENDVIYVILTKRSPKLSSYSGEVSLPGGRKDEADTDDIQTALREAEEEIGLDPGLVDVVTILEPFTTKEKVTVVPVMGILWNKQAFNPVPNVDEVESIFYAPLEMFLKDENRRHVEKEFEGDRYLLQYFDLETDNKAYVIWALTAGMLIAAASLVYQREVSLPSDRTSEEDADDIQTMLREDKDKIGLNSSLLLFLNHF